jgi:glycosyltransferase involved in cell wall biosynthesis
MRIAQIAPLYERVPPKFYGGTERVVSYLTEELVSLGHEVTLFASGDSKTSARLISPCKRALRLSPDCIDKLAYHYIMLDQVRELSQEFDMLHFHVDYLHFPFSRTCEVPHVTTLHGRLDIPELAPLYRQFVDNPVVSISISQRKPLCWIRWVANVYHGLPAANFRIGSGKGGYLAFLGRIAREKRVDRAIQIALESGMPLKIAAKVDPSDREYYESEIRPLLAHPNIEYIGEIREDQKSEFLGNAYAQLFPIDWPEPFGLCMIEAMACGTPTIAFGNGSVPEVLTHGVTGFVVDSVREAVEAVPKISELDREACRLEFEGRFTASRMAEDYVRLYGSLLERERNTMPLDISANRLFSRAAST